MTWWQWAIAGAVGIAVLFFVLVAVVNSAGIDPSDESDDWTDRTL